MRIGPGRRRQLVELARVACHRAASIRLSVSSRGSAATIAAELGPALAAGQGESKHPQVAADGLQLADDRPSRPAPFALSSLKRSSVGRASSPSETGSGSRTCRAYSRASFRSRAPRSAGTSSTGAPAAAGELLVAHAPRSPRSPAAGSRGEVVVHVVLGDAELVEVARGRLRPGCRRRVATATVAAELALRQLAPVLAEDQAVVHVLRRRRTQRVGQLAMERLVRPMVVAANDVRDLELDVVDDAGQVVRRGAVLAEERDLSEAVAAELLGGLAIGALALALPDRAFVPGDAEPLEVAQDLLLPAGNVPRSVRVVDPQQEPIAEITVCDSAERVADVERPGRARCKANPLHANESTLGRMRVGVLGTGVVGRTIAGEVARARSRRARSVPAQPVRTRCRSRRPPRTVSSSSTARTAMHLSKRCTPQARKTSPGKCWSKSPTHSISPRGAHRSSEWPNGGSLARADPARIPGGEGRQDAEHGERRTSWSIRASSPASTTSSSAGTTRRPRLEVAELLQSFGWPADQILDLGDITAARGQESVCRALGAADGRRRHARRSTSTSSPVSPWSWKRGSWPGSTSTAGTCPGGARATRTRSSSRR